MLKNHTQEELEVFFAEAKQCVPRYAAAGRGGVVAAAMANFATSLCKDRFVEIPSFASVPTGNKMTHFLLAYLCTLEVGGTRVVRSESLWPRLEHPTKKTSTRSAEATPAPFRVLCINRNDAKNPKVREEAQRLLAIGNYTQIIAQAEFLPVAADETQDALVEVGRSLAEAERNARAYDDPPLAAMQIALSGMFSVNEAILEYRRSRNPAVLVNTEPIVRVMCDGILAYIAAVAERQEKILQPEDLDEVGSEDE